MKAIVIYIDVPTNKLCIYIRRAWTTDQFEPPGNELR